MNYLVPVSINWSLIKNFNLSEKALVAYVAILNSCKLTYFQLLNPLSMVKNLLGPEAKNTIILRQGFDELIKKEVIKTSYREKRVVFYDLTLLSEYTPQIFIKENFSFFSKFEDLNASICNLYRLYILIQYSLSKQRANGEDDVWATSKRELAQILGCSRYVIGDRLEELKTLGLIAYEDYSKYPVLVMKEKFSLFISLPDLEEEIIKKVRHTISSQYLKGILPPDEEIEKDNHTPEVTEEDVPNFDLDDFVQMANENFPSSSSKKTQDKKEIEEGDEVTEENSEDSNVSESEEELLKELEDLLNMEEEAE